jgi:hypothetical protein
LKANYRIFVGPSYSLHDQSFEVFLVEYGTGIWGRFCRWAKIGGRRIASAYEPTCTGHEVEDAFRALYESTPSRALMPADGSPEWVKAVGGVYSPTFDDVHGGGPEHVIPQRQDGGGSRA